MASLLEVGNPILGAQRTIADVIAAEPNPLELLRGASTRDVLEAVRSVSNRILNYAAHHGIAAVAGVDLPAALLSDDNAQKPSRARGALNADPPARAIEAAVGVTAALFVLNAPSLDEAGMRAEWLVRGQNADTGPAELRSCLRDNCVANAVVIRASAERLGPELQLRYRASSVEPKAPSLQREDVARIARALPRWMWPSWSNELLRGSRKTGAMRTALSIATLLVGSSVKPIEAASMLGEVASANALNQRLWSLCASSDWTLISSRLIRLSKYLDRNGAPIDYDRRRRLDYSSLLKADDWQSLCRQAGVHRPCVAVPTSVRKRLIEKISGGPAAPDPAGASAPSRQPIAFDPEVLSALDGPLDDYAERFLRDLGIYEPVEWSPSL